MQEALSSYMKVGLIHFMAYPVANGEGPIVETFKKIAADPFFEAVEVTWIRDSEARKQVRFMKETAALTLAYGAQPRLLSTKMNINDLDEAKRQAAVDNLKEGIDEAYELGCSEFQFLSRSYEPGKEQAYLNALIASTKEICAYAKSKGSMPVVLEVFDHTIDKKSLLGPASLVKEYAQAVCSEYDNFGIMIDCSHIPMIGETIDEAVDPIVPYIRHVHVGNTLIGDPNHPSYGDYHPRFGYPGSENDTEYLASFLQKMKDIGYLAENSSNILSFEVKPQAGEDADLVVANAKRTLLSAWRCVQ